MANINPELGVADVNVRSLAEHWWALTARGVAAILFGLLLFFAPGIALLTLVIMFGAYVIVDGVFNVVAAVRHAREQERWGWLAFSGLVSILAGVLTFLWSGISGLALLMLIAGWSIVTGVAQIIAAVRLRKEIRGEWLLILSGIVSVAFGLLISLYPAAGALAVALWIGVYAVVYGALLVAFSLRLRSWHIRGERRPPVGGVATPA